MEKLGRHGKTKVSGENTAQRALAKRESLELIHEIIGIDTETKFKAVKCKLARDATLPGGP